MFDNAPAISRTVVDEQDNLNATLLAATGLGNNAAETLEPGADDFIAAIQRLRAPLRVVGEYSPEIGCVLKGTSKAIDRFAPIIGGIRPGLFVSSNFLPGAPAYTYPESLPIVNASGGPNCRGLPDVPEQAVRRHRWYRTPFLVTDNAYIPFQPNTELQFDAPSTLQFLFNGAYRRKGRLLMSRLGNEDRTLINVGVFTVVMLLVAAGLVVVFGEFRFGSDNTYHATFTDASRLKAGQDVRIAGVPVGSVKDVTLNPDNTVDVTFDVNKRYQLYTSTRAVVRYENLVGDRYLEITSGPGDLREGAARRHASHATPSRRLDLDALLGGLRPVLKGLDGNKVNEVSNAIIELLQGQGGALSQMLSSTGSFTQNLADA